MKKIILLVLALFVLVPGVFAGQEAHGVDLESATSDYADWRGEQVLIGNDSVTVTQFTKSSNSQAVGGVIIDDSGNNITTCVFSGDVCDVTDETLSANTDYHILCIGDTPPNWISGINAGASYPYAGSLLDWVSFSNWAGTGAPTIGFTHVYCVESVTVNLANSNPTVTWANETPADGKTFNASTLPAVFYFLADDADAGDTIDCHLSDGTTFYDSMYNVPKNTNSSLNVTSFASDANYTMNITCDDGTVNVSSTVKYITYDTVPPDVPLIGQSFPLADNTSRGWNSRSVPLNVSCGDENELWSFELNASDGVNDWGFYIEDLNVTNYTYDTAQDFGAFTNGTVLFDVVCYDSHTKSKIKDYDTITDLGSGMLGYNTGDNLIMVYTLSDLDDLKTDKQTDRYDMTFDFKQKLDEYEFFVWAEKGLNYQEGSDYSGHFVTGTNWVDFVLANDPGAVYVVEWINSQTYKVTVKTSLKKLVFSSVGGLNKAENHASFVLGDLPPTTPTTLNPPNGTYTDNSSLTLECSGATDPDSDTVFYDYSVGTDPSSLSVACLNVGTSCAYNDTVGGWLFWNCRANDTFFSSSATVTRAVRADDRDVISLVQNYSADVLHSETIEFRANVTFNELRFDDVDGFINISESLFPLTVTDQDNYTELSADVVLNVSLWTSNPISFNWALNLTYLNNSVFQNNSFGGLIYPFQLFLYNCSADNESILFNITGFDEETIDLLAVDIDATFEVWKSDSDYAETFTFEWNDSYFNETTSKYVCLSYNSSVYVDAYLLYTRAFTQRWYISNLLVENNTNNEVHLFNRDSSSGISQLEGTTRYISNYNYFSNVIGKLLRYYPGENVWRTVQMDKSGDFGLVNYNIREVDTDYKFIFQDTDNNVLKSTESMKFSCDDALCELTFLLDPFSGPEVGNALEVTSSFDNVTGLISVEWIDATGVTEKVRTLVTKETMAGTTVICDNEVSSSAGSYDCNVSQYTGQLLLRVYRTASPETPVIYEWYEKLAGKLFDSLSVAEQAFWTLGFSVTITIFGVVISPVAGIAMFILSVISLLLLGIAKFLTLAFVTVALVLGVVVGIKVRN